jgi:hypothetical protein
MVLNVE